MSYLDVASGAVVNDLPGEQKAGFIRRTYGHLALALGALLVIESYIISSGLGDQLLSLLGQFKWSWLILMGAYIGVSVVADKWARNGASRELQYAGLGLYVLALAVIFAPLMTIAVRYAPTVLPQAAMITAALVTALTLVVFTIRKDFSFLAPALMVGLVLAIGIIVASVLFGFNLGVFFSGAMVVLMAASVLYTTSNILHVYREDQHVAASLALFSSVAIMFYYIVNILLSFAQE